MRSSTLPFGRAGLAAEEIGDACARLKEFGDSGLQYFLGHSEPAENGCYTGVEARLEHAAPVGRGAERVVVDPEELAHADVRRTFVRRGPRGVRRPAWDAEQFSLIVQ